MASVRSTRFVQILLIVCLVEMAAAEVRCFRRQDTLLSGSKTKVFIFDNIGSCSCKAAVEQEKLTRGVMSYLPQCQPDGAFAPRQTWEANGLVWCVNRRGHPTSKEMDLNANKNMVCIS